MRFVEAVVGELATRRTVLPTPFLLLAVVDPESGAIVAASYAPFDRRSVVAEDNATNRYVASLMLRNLGCSVELAADGREALRRVDAADYDIVFMDCEMPEMDGFEATAAIRSRLDAKAWVPIVAVTAQAMQGDRERCLRAGMDDYISKPVSPQAFAAALERWVAGETPAKPVAVSALPPRHRPASSRRRRRSILPSSLACASSRGRPTRRC